MNVKKDKEYSPIFELRIEENSDSDKLEDLFSFPKNPNTSIDILF